jgi:HTH-type transcriptional regulator/antitoxin HipB
MAKNDISYGRIHTAEDLGHLVRAHRKGKGLTLETVSGLGNLSTRFLSEFERGKETAEIGKILKALRTLGLDVIVQPRGGSTHSSHGAYSPQTKTDKS